MQRSRGSGGHERHAPGARRIAMPSAGRRPVSAAAGRRQRPRPHRPVLAGAAGRVVSFRHWPTGCRASQRKRPAMRRAPARQEGWAPAPCRSSGGGTTTRPVVAPLWAAARARLRALRWRSCRIPTRRRGPGSRRRAGSRRAAIPPFAGVIAGRRRTSSSKRRSSRGRYSTPPAIFCPGSGIGHAEALGRGRDQLHQACASLCERALTRNADSAWITARTRASSTPCARLAAAISSWNSSRRRAPSASPPAR